MDISIRTNSGAPLITPWSARGMSNEAFAARQTADAHKAVVAGAVMKAEEGPAFKTANSNKDLIKQQIEGIRQRLTVLRKLFAGDAKGMAQALTQIFKELRAALKAYKAAGGSEFDAADGAASQVTAPAPTPADDAAETDGDTPPVTAADAKVAAASYAEVDQGLREAIGSDGLEFLRQVRVMVNTIEDRMLSPARIQHKAQKPTKDTDEAFKTVEDELKQLRQDMDDMQSDIKRDAPTLGTQLSVA